MNTVVPILPDIDFMEAEVPDLYRVFAVFAVMAIVSCRCGSRMQSGGVSRPTGMRAPIMSASRRWRGKA